MSNIEHLKPFMGQSILKKLKLLESLKPKNDTVKEVAADFEIHPAQHTNILDPFNEWLKSGSKRGLFLGFRKCGKTDLITIYSVSKWILEDTSRTVIIMTRKMDRARSILRKIGDNLKSCGLIGDFNQDQIRLTYNKQPTVLALTVNSTTKGWHADLLICDDPVEPTDEYSTALKQKVNMIYEESKNIATKVFVIGQYVAVDDIYVKLNNSKTVDKISWWINEVPLDLIDKLDLDLEDLRQDLRVYGKNYEGVFYPDENAPFGEILIGEYGNSWDYGLLDPSDGKNDYSAFVYLKDYGDFVAVKGVMYKSDWHTAIQLEKENIDKLQRFYYETNSVGTIAYTIFKQLTNTKVYGFSTNKNKVDKILTLLPFVKSGRIRIDESSDKVFIDTVKNWNPKAGNNQIDDGIDALAMIIKQIGLFIHKRR